MMATRHYDDKAFLGSIEATSAVDLSGATSVTNKVGVRVLDANAALTLAATDGAIILSSTDASAKAATMTATHAGHRISVSLNARSSTGTYTLAATRGSAGTVTLDATGEVAELVYSGSAWHVVSLTGASFA
jgi:hypothetical protein